MVQKVKITNVESGETIRVGSVRSSEVNNTLLFGFLPIPDALKIGITLFAIATFIVKDDLRIASLEDSRKKLTSISEEMQNYMQTSDAFQSSVYGTEFKGGSPVNTSYINKTNIVGGKV